MASLLGLLLGLWIIYHAVRYACKSIGWNLNKTTNTQHFFGFFLFSLSVFLKPLRFFLMGLSAPIKHLLGIGFENTGTKSHEGFMSFLEKFFLLNRNHKGLLLNGKTDRLSAKNSFTHALLVARTGGGKTSSFIIPNILDRDNASILVTDLSGELYQKTSGFMKNIGYNVLCLNLIDPSLSNTYNPLAEVNNDKDILEIAQIILSSSGYEQSKDPIWEHGAKNILAILIACLVSQAKKEGTREFCNLANVRYLLNNFGKTGEGIQEFIFKYADIKTLSEWRGFISGNEKTTQGFLSTAINALGVIRTDIIASLTANNEIDFSAIRSKKTIVYLMIPQHELHTYSFLLNLFYSRFFKSCFESNIANPLPVYCLLDEAGHTKIPNLPAVVTTIRKYKVSISLILQSLSQLETAYGVAGARTIIEGGIGSKIFFGGCDFETCETLSKILGNITTSHFDKDGKTQNLIRPLMTAQEIRMMSDRQALYLFANRKPIILNTTPYYKSWKFNGYTQIKPYQITPKTHKTPQFVQL